MSQETNVVRSLEQDAKRITDSSESVDSKVYAGRKLSKFFQVEVSISLFGQRIWHWVFPPESK